MATETYCFLSVSAPARKNFPRGKQKTSGFYDVQDVDKRGTPGDWVNNMATFINLHGILALSAFFSLVDLPFMIDEALAN